VVTRWVLQAWPTSNIAKVFVGVIWIEYILLCISILTTKQHYLFDLATGLILAIFAWQFILPIMEQIANLTDDQLDLNYGSGK
jgi:membrane-associated phospholipid phosphatase